MWCALLEYHLALSSENFYIDKMVLCHIAEGEADSMKHNTYSVSTIIVYYSMALSDKRILGEIEKGNIIITPYKEENLSTASYDVTLGEYYFSEKKNTNNLYNPYNQKDVERVWGIAAQQAKTAKEVFENEQFEFTGIDEDDKVIVLDPGETILAHTEEFIGGKNHITTMMKARSSLGRNFIEICKCAGWGDVGYTNRWTMEITNNARHYRIPLIVGRRIAQIIFFDTGEIQLNNYVQQGKYQATEDINETIKQWDPKSMLPKMYNDREIKHKN